MKEFGGWLEMNIFGLRKGMVEGYFKREIVEEWIKMGGRFMFFDDSYGIG